MLKKSTLAILGLAASGMSFAGTMGPVCSPDGVTVPCEARQWDLGAQALYLRPTYSADKGYENSLAPRYKNTDPRWGWGYRIEGSFHYHYDNDLTLTYTHYDIDTDRGGYFGPTRFATSVLPFDFHRENKFDQVNLVLGQHVDMGTWTKVRFYGGLQYAKLRVDERLKYPLVPPALLQQGVLGFQQYRNADFNGGGPAIGMDYSVDLARGFSLTANAASSILYSSTRYAEGYIFAPTGLIRFIGNQSRKAIVPGLEARIGLGYAHPCAQGVLNLEGGFQTLNYFSVFESRGQVGFNTRPHDTNFGLYGPYFGAKWVGNV